MYRIEVSASEQSSALCSSACSACSAWNHGRS